MTDYGAVKTPILDTTGQPILVSIREAINGYKSPIKLEITAENAQGIAKAQGDFTIEYIIRYALGGDLEESSEFIVGGKNVKNVLYNLIDRRVLIRIWILD